MQHFTSVNDVRNISALIAQAKFYQQNPLVDEMLGKGKRIALLFLNPSLRTRMSTQIAAENLGMKVLSLNADKDGWKLEFEDDVIMNGTAVEHIKDAAPILGNYCDVLAVRCFPTLTDSEQDYDEIIINQFVKYAGVPVVSLESATVHPLQSLADLMSIDSLLQQIKKRPKIVLSWAPHVKAIPQCVANSFAQWVNAWNVEKEEAFDFVITHPQGYELNEKFIGNAKICYDQAEALQDADFVYVKNWSSYTDYGKILCEDESWMITPDQLTNTNNAKVMHCLPVRRNVELSAAVLDSESSIVTMQASNRVWAAQAVLSNILKELNK
jgi:N-succinyl-L-ornithine transcarbamylase